LEAVVKLFIKTVLACFLLAYFAGTVIADTPVRIFYGGKELACSSKAVYDGKQIFVPLSCLEELGIAYEQSANANLAVTSASGRCGEVPLTQLPNEKMIALDRVLEIIGGELVWDESKSNAIIYAHLQSVEFVDDTIKINCSLPVRCTTRKWQNKLIADIRDTKLASEAREVYVGGPIVDRLRLGQYDPSTTRVVADLLEDANLALESRVPAAQLVFLVGKDLPKSGTQDNLAQSQPSAQPAQAQSCKIEVITLESKDADGFDLFIQTSSKPQVVHSYGVKPPEVEVFLKNTLFPDEVTQLDANHPLIKSAKLTKTTASSQPAVKFNLAFERIVAYEILSMSNGIRLRVRIPDKAGGTLRGKTVVIDPGHGGREKGACWGDLYEKDLNLRIANAAKVALEREGARVIMTRENDVALSLAARAQIALERRADLFVSIHCNSNSSPGSASGIETYYHMDEPSPKALAYAIHEAICSQAKMPDRRARSDRSLYASGLGVLRRLSGSGIPGVLIECGYVNHPSDRSKLVSADYRAKLAEGIVKALKAYIEGTPLE
jgi:N-acetylmuramoyl-L-alanine amidase